MPPRKDRNTTVHTQDLRSLLTSPIPPSLSPGSYTASRLKDADAAHLHHTTRRYFIGPVPEVSVIASTDERDRRLGHIIKGYKRTASRFVSVFERPLQDSSSSCLSQGQSSPSFQAPSAGSSSGRGFGVKQPNNITDEAGTSQSKPAHTIGIQIPSPVDNHNQRRASPAREGHSGAGTIRSTLSAASSAPAQIAANVEVDDSDASLLRLHRSKSGVQAGLSTQPRSRPSPPLPTATVLNPDGRPRLAATEAVAAPLHPPLSQHTTTLPPFLRGDQREGRILKFGKMLVRVDESTRTKLPDEYCENLSYRVPLQTQRQWREYIVVCRACPQAPCRTLREDQGSGGTLQFYQTRVIPELEKWTSEKERDGAKKRKKKKFKFEIALDRGQVRVNLFSSLDKTVCLWKPVSGRTVVYLLRPLSLLDGMEWFTFLAQLLGWRQSEVLGVDMPDFHTTVRVRHPFSEVTVKPDAVDSEPISPANRISELCLNTLNNALESDWREVLQDMVRSRASFSLAWKHYDRLEWIYGFQAERLPLIMAMIKTHDLQFRQFFHYPTQADPTDRLGYGNISQEEMLGGGANDDGLVSAKPLDEPYPVEGYLTRLTSDGGDTRTFWTPVRRRVYCTAFDHYLFFLKQNSAVPPPPPLLPSDVSSDVVPTMYEVDPFPLQNGAVEWVVNPRSQGAIDEMDEQAQREWARNGYNLTNSDAMIDLRNVAKVCMLQVDGSSVANNKVVADDPSCIFEIVLVSGLIVHFLAATHTAAQAWVDRLSSLARYWKLRGLQDSMEISALRYINMHRLGDFSTAAESTAAAEAGKVEASWVAASPAIWNVCGIFGCRPIHFAGMLYVGMSAAEGVPAEQYYGILAYGRLMLFSVHVRYRSGKRRRQIHMPRTQVIDLAGCYILSGRLAEPRELVWNAARSENDGYASRYRCQPPAAALPTRMAGALPRVWRGDGTAVTDDDDSLSFAIWRNTARKGLFRARVPVDEAGKRRHSRSNSRGRDGDETPHWHLQPQRDGPASQASSRPSHRTELKWKLVSRLGLKGEAMILIARSRVERDRWVIALDGEIQNVRAARRQTGEADEMIRFSD